MSDKNKSSSCSCNSEAKLIFPCSGAADVGEISDKVGRRLTREKLGAMSCLAGIGGNVSGIIESAKSACKVLAIDGCSVQCAKKTLLERGLKNFAHIVVTEHGFIKGKCPATDDAVEKIVLKCKELL